MEDTELNNSNFDKYILSEKELQVAPGYSGKAAGAAPQSRENWFQTSLIEKIMAILIWPISYVYSTFMCISPRKEWTITFGIFMLLFIGATEAFFFKRKRTVESFIFLALTIVATVSSVFSLGSVWSCWMQAFFAHLFVVYWVLCRSGRLAEGESSHMFIWDGITGFFVMTFKNFHLDVRAIISIFKSIGKKNEDGKKKNIGGAIIGIVIGIIFLCIAVACLKNADDNFKNLVDSVGAFLKIEVSFEFVWKCFNTVFLSMYFYGLLGGCYRETEEQVQQRGRNVMKAVAALRKIPGIVWVIMIALFSIFYIVFFGLQGSYLFDAFSMTLPTQYTFSEYARKGFGDMCGVVFVNFAVTWLTTRTSVFEENTGIAKAVKIASAILTVESIFFAVIAMLKLLMYIEAYGFTPLRLQSAWLVVVLAYACVCILISLFTGKKTAKFWFIGSSVSLAVLCLV